MAGNACSSTNEPSPPDKPHVQGDTDFVSALSPEDQASARAAGSPAAPSADSAEEEAAGAVSLDDDANSAERAITEADIIHVDGNTLYALSEFSGLTLVDIANPADLEVVGRAPSSGEPFEMYVKDDVAISMVNAYGHYEYDDDAQATIWAQSSRVLALDTSTPDNIVEVGDLSVPGYISDSRLVGDVLYLVTTEYNCWGCSKGPATVVTSFNIGDLANIRQIDQLRFEEPEETYIAKRSITVTPERIYIGGRNWDWQTTDGGSTIQVVDIADPEGDLVEGATLAIWGQIDSRWQMDEHEGVLRVLSQWETWRDDSPPALETYRVNSSSNITKLATLPVELPRPEVLQSVRFDGNRAYAITFERTDPLFTFDLSDPEEPKQVGALEIPGWVYHMEPRGDRVYAIGFDQEHEDGALHVSLFDVADLASPQILDRVNFGGDWASFAEDQDRIHKSFKLLDEEGFLVVPFSGWDWDEDACTGGYNSGIQLVDFSRDNLKLRGVAPQIGEARRAFVHGDHLFGVGDDAVQSFDIEDRDHIQKVDTIETARNIETLRVVGDKVLRFGTDWWTDRTVLDVTDVDNVEDAAPRASIDLSELLEVDNECTGGAYWGNVYVVGSYGYVERYAYDYSNGEERESVTFLVIDLSLDVPEVTNHLKIDLGSSKEDSYRYFSGVVQTDSALLVGISEYDYSNDVRTTTNSYQVIDTRDPAQPELAANFEVPARLSNNGWGRFMGGCGLDFGWGWGYWGYYGYGRQNTALVSGDLIASTHVEALEDDISRGRYYLDRIDVSDPAAPVFLDKVNVPGRVVHFEGDSGRVLTIEDSYEPLDLDREACWEKNGAEADVEWTYTTTNASNGDWDTGVCNRVTKRIHSLELSGSSATLTDSASLNGGAWYFASTAITADRVFIKQYQVKEITETYNDETYTYWGTDETRIRVLNASLDKVTDFDTTGSSNWSDLLARGKRAFTSDSGTLRVFDTTDADEPKQYDRELLGYGCSTLEVRDGVALCAQGKKGVEAFELE